MVVSQGLRSVTQTLGCVVSLYLISPQMTVVVGVALPSDDCRGNYIWSCATAVVQTSSGTGLSVWSILVRLSVCAMHEHIDLLQVAISYRGG